MTYIAFKRRPMCKRQSLVALMLVASFVATLASAKTPQERGLEIALEADRRDNGFGDSQAEMIMTLTNSHGERAVRSLRIRTQEKSNDGNRSLIIFDSPGDIKGTAFLSFSHKVDADDQWLYLPALKRVKRISRSNQSGPFFGSEFSYEDMSSQEPEKYTYKYIKEEIVDGRKHYILEMKPINPKSGYSRQITWLDTEYFRVSKIDFYDRRGSHLKTLTVSGYKQYLQKYWRAEHLLMVNHQTGKKTKLTFNDMIFRNNFSERDFSKTALRKVR
ncbi:MAG: outer membrane lipoprotein-sorting protein [Paraglaciecola sp.]|jgi:outer membrane lipoprotein-sorting protein